MIKFRSLLLLFVSLFLVDVVLGQGCSQCKLIAEQGSELGEASFGSNINYGILYLMAMPYIIGIAVITYIFRKRLSVFFKGLLKK
jgi:hypothetical protein